MNPLLNELARLRWQHIAHKYLGKLKQLEER